MNLKLEKPKSDAPGYLMRLERLRDLQRYVKAPDEQTDFIELLKEVALPYIAEPADRAEAIHELLNLSEDDYREVIRFVMMGGNVPGGAENPTAPEQSGTS